MDKKQRLFIYGRKEVGILFLLGVTVAVFAFTLGVHLGKKVGLDIPSPDSPSSMASAVPTVQDKNPTNQEFQEQTQGALQAADESLNQSLHEEVGRQGIRLDNPKQVDLPKGTKSADAGATDVAGDERRADQSAHQEPAEPHKPKNLHQTPPPGGGKYTLQVGSFPSVSEAQAAADQLEKAGLKPFLRPAEVKGLGKRYRVFVGSYATREEAQKAGENYRSHNRFNSFIVSKIQNG